MFNWINPNFILIKVSREAQRRKREKIVLDSGVELDRHPSQVHMAYNQQVGTVVMIGHKVLEMIPEIRVGDKAFFHHSVEGTCDKTAKGMGSDFMADDNDPDWRYYFVRGAYVADNGEASAGLLYGIIKDDGCIYMSPYYTLAIASPEEQDCRWLKRKGALYLFDNFKEERTQMEKRLEELKFESETHPSRAATIMKEMEAITKSLNKKRAAAFVPIFTSFTLRRDFGVPLDMTYVLFYEMIGSKSTTPQVTQIDLEGKTFYLLRSDYILAAKKMGEKTLRRLNGEKVDDDIIAENEILSSVTEFEEKARQETKERGSHLFVIRK